MVEFLGIYWAGADRLIYFPLFVIAIALIIKRYDKIKLTSNQLCHKNNSKLLLKNFSLKRQFFKTLFLCCALGSLFIALLQPQWNKKEQIVVQEGRDLLIMLDISRSMLAQDLKPNRLEFAKLKIRTLLSKLQFERVGLILFSGSAFLQSPLTADHPAFLMFLNQVDTEVISSGTTAIDNALQKAVEVFSQSKDRKSKLALLITDGEDFSLNLDPIKQKAAELDIKLFALGIGTPDGAPIPKFDHKGNQIGHEKDETGTIALTKLNEQLLKNMCQTLNGHYFRATNQDTDLKNLTYLIQKFEKEKFTDRKISRYEDQYSWFLGIAWLLLLVEWIL